MPDGARADALAAAQSNAAQSNAAQSNAAQSTPARSATGEGSALAGPAVEGAGRSAALAAVLQRGLHAIALLLVVVATTRAVTGGASPVLAVLAGAAFLAWYAVGAVMGAQQHASRRVHSWVGGLAVIWIGAIAVSAEFIWLAFLLWLLAGRFLRLRGALILSAVIFGLVAYAPIWHHGRTDYATIFGPLIGAIFAVGIARGYLQLLRDAAEREQLVGSLTRTQQEILDLQDELALTQRHSGMTTERLRIARDIHDTVAQSLPSIRLLAHAAAAGSPDDGAVGDAGTTHRALTQIETLAAEAATDVRRILAALTPAELDHGALGAALDRMLRRLADETTVATALHVDASLPQLTSDAEIALLRAAQSALANVRQHARASRVTISLIDDGDQVRLDIIDDGRGFDADRRDESRAGGGYGLGFIEGRLRELGGGLELASRPGAGTELSAHLPLHPLPQETA